MKSSSKPLQKSKQPKKHRVKKTRQPLKTLKHRSLSTKSNRSSSQKSPSKSLNPPKSSISQQFSQSARFFSTPQIHKFNAQEISDNLSTIPKWFKSPGKRDAIERKFQFKDFNEAFAFMTRTAIVAEQMCHHPEWFNVYNNVNVVLSTHDVGGLSSNDFQLAQTMDKFAQDFKV